MPRTSLPYYGRVPGISTAAVRPAPDSGPAHLIARRSDSPSAPPRQPIAGTAASTACVETAPEQARSTAGELVKKEDERATARTRERGQRSTGTSARERAQRRPSTALLRLSVGTPGREVALPPRRSQHQGFQPRGPTLLLRSPAEHQSSHPRPPHLSPGDRTIRRSCYDFPYLLKPALRAAACGGRPRPADGPGGSRRKAPMGPYLKSSGLMNVEISAVGKHGVASRRARSSSDHSRSLSGSYDGSFHPQC